MNTQPPKKNTNKMLLIALFSGIGVIVILLIVILILMLPGKETEDASATSAAYIVNAESPTIDPTTPPPSTTPAALIPSPSPPPTDNPADDIALLQGNLDDFFAANALAANDRWAVCAVDVESGALAYSGNSANAPAIAASLIKIFIAGAIYDEAENRADFSIGSNERASLETMLRDSDNAAANELIKALGNGGFEAGFARVNAFAESIGCHDTKLNRKLAPAPGETVADDNYTSVQDCATALRLIAQGEFISEEASAEIASWMGAPSWNTNKTSKIQAGVFAIDSSAGVANKTGENITPCIVENDIAIITLSGGEQYVLCIMSNSDNSSRAKGTICQVTGLVHNFFLELKRP